MGRSWHSSLIRRRAHIRGRTGRRGTAPQPVFPRGVGEKRIFRRGEIARRQSLADAAACRSGGKVQEFLAIWRRHGRRGGQLNPLSFRQRSAPKPPARPAAGPRLPTVLSLATPRASRVFADPRASALSEVMNRLFASNVLDVHRLACRRVERRGRRFRFSPRTDRGVRS